MTLWTGSKADNKTPVTLLFPTVVFFLSVFPFPQFLFVSRDPTTLWIAEESSPYDVQQAFKGSFKGSYLLNRLVGAGEANEQQQHLVAQRFHVGHHVHEVDHTHWGSQDSLQNRQARVAYYFPCASAEVLARNIVTKM